MKLDNWTGLTTNSSSMIYVLRKGMEEKAKALLEKYLEEYKVDFKTAKDFPAFVEKYPHTGNVIYRYPDIDPPRWKEPPFPSGNDDDRWDEYYKAYTKAARAYREQVEKAIGDNEFTWFVPDHEDNEMSEEEMKLYEYISNTWTRLS